MGHQDMPIGEICTPDQRLRIFVSSTLKELAAECEAVGAAILKLRPTPVTFESGARPHAPRSLYRANRNRATSSLASTDRATAGPRPIRALTVNVGARQKVMQDWRDKHAALAAMPVGKLWRVADAGEQRKLLTELFEGVQADTAVYAFKYPVWLQSWRWTGNRTMSVIGTWRDPEPKG